MQADFTLSVVIPVYNNASTLILLHQKLIIEIKKYFKDYQIIFVDDHSSDDSWLILKTIAEKDVKCVVVSLSKNIGQNLAVFCGLTIASKDINSIMDADLQDDPSAIHLLASQLNCQYKVVYAGRSGYYQSKKKMFTSYLFKKVMFLLSSKNLPVDAGLFLVMKREVAELLLEYYGENIYIVGLLGKLQVPGISIPIRRNKNPDEKSNYTFYKRIRLGIKGITMFMIPLKKRSSKLELYPICEILNA